MEPEQTQGNEDQLNLRKSQKKENQNKEKDNFEEKSKTKSPSRSGTPSRVEIGRGQEDRTREILKLPTNRFAILGKSEETRRKSKNFDEITRLSKTCPETTLNMSSEATNTSLYPVGSPVVSRAKLSGSAPKMTPWEKYRMRKVSEPFTSKAELKPSLIKPQDWFKDIVGVTEPQFRKLDVRPIYSNEKGLYIKNTVTGKITKAGNFTLLPLGSLIEYINTSQKKAKFGSRKKLSKIPKPATLDIVMRHPSDRTSTKFVNVAYLQSLPENRQAVFQVASNFNGIESVDEGISPGNSPTFTQDYVLDNTQGPAASISAGGSAICRVHAPFYDPNLPSKKWGQTKRRQINFLEELNMHFPNVNNGYVQVSSNDPVFPEPDKEPLDSWNKLLTLYKIGYQKSAQVTSAHKTNGHFIRVDNRNQVVDQVFCAALNIVQGAQGRMNGGARGAENKAKFLLKCAYEGAYLSAIYNGRKKLFLTLIGAGSFGNKLEWIYDAILKAHLKWGTHPNNTIKKVYIVLYTSSQFIPSFVESMKRCGVYFSKLVYQDGECYLEEKFQPIRRAALGILPSSLQYTQTDIMDMVLSKSAEETPRKKMVTLREEKSFESILRNSQNRKKTSKQESDFSENGHSSESSSKIELNSGKKFSEFEGKSSEEEGEKLLSLILSEEEKSPTKNVIEFPNREEKNSEFKKSDDEGGAPQNLEIEHGD